MTRKYRNYTDQDIINYSKEVKSIAGLLRKLDLVVVGGNYINIKKNLQRLKVDTSHWTGMAWNRGEQLKDYSQYKRGINFKKHLIRDKGHKCEECHNTSWRDQPIPLELHHIDGNRGNNDPSNLQLLCCNCHALTENWRGKVNLRFETGSASELLRQQHQHQT